LTCPDRHGTLGVLTIRLNGEPYELPGPLSVAALLARLQIDPRRVAVERNTVVVRRPAYDTTLIEEGDEIEIVNIVGGGAGAAARAPGHRRHLDQAPGGLAADVAGGPHARCGAGRGRPRQIGAASDQASPEPAGPAGPAVPGP
jgi:thiamine biosynthesis protein ThiS